MTSAEAKLRALVASLDDPALEALASKGLLRRAQKDLDRGVHIAIEREDQGAISVRVEQFEVVIPEAGPAKATCSCPAPAICQHILTAVLFLQRQTEPATSTPQNTAEQELLSFTADQLETWAGKQTFRAALELASRTPAEASAERGVTIRFPALNTQCHYPPGAGLDGIIVAGTSKDIKRVAIAAVIAFQKLKGITWEAPAAAPAVLEEATGAPRSRSEVIDSALQLFSELLDNGLARISSAAQQRLATLSVSALGVNLPRLSLILHGISDECALALARDANSDLGRMLGRMSNAYALCSALRQNPADTRPDLVGWRRTRYDEVGSLDLLGVSAWPWRTASGYAGLTLLFWDTAGKTWHSWTESRPTQRERFQPVARYTQPGPWEGADSPRQLARSSFRLMNARRNPDHRLSGSSRSRVLVTGPSDLAANGPPILTDWTQLSSALQSKDQLGLAEGNPLDGLFVVKPTVWGPRVFDPLTQLFSWPLLDAHSRLLLIEIGFDAFSEPCIRHLERTPPESFQGAVLVGRVQRSANRTPAVLALRVYSIHRADGEVVHLWLDTVAHFAAQPAAPVSAEEYEGFEDEQQDEPETAYSPGLNRLLDEADEALLILAESGISGASPLRVERLQPIAARAERFGLAAMAAGLRNVATRPQASTVLACAYLTQLHRRAMSSALAG